MRKKLIYDYNDDSLQPGLIADDVSLVLKGRLCKASCYRKELSVDMCVFRSGLASCKPGCNSLRDDRQLQFCCRQRRAEAKRLSSLEKTSNYGRKPSLRWGMPD